MNPAVAKLVAVTHGTAFAVTAEYALTAFHVVGDRQKGALTHAKVTLTFADGTVPATVVGIDPESDAALLRMDAPLPSGEHPVPVTEEVILHSRWWARGYPMSDPGRITVHGSVVDPHTHLPGTKVAAIQLICEQAGTRSPQRLNGFSGAPVLVGNPPGAIGLIRWNPTSGDDPGVAVGGSVYACPVATLLDRWPEELAQAMVPPSSECGPKQLPRDIGDFTGRERQVQALLGHLYGEHARTVVISAVAGMPGVGKSTLAIHVAHMVAVRFRDAQLYVNLRGAEDEALDPAEVLVWFLQELGIAPDAMPRPSMREGRYRSLLAGKHALVLLDNALNERQVRPLLPGSPTCAVIVTSRSRLDALEGARTCQLEVMDLDEATQLLAQIAGPDCVQREPYYAQEVVQLCGYLPLAVRIAGTNAHKSLSRLADRLADERTRLDLLDVGDRAVRASFALSYKDLSATEARIFRLLGLLRGEDFSSALAAALVDKDVHSTEGVLNDLWRAGLLEAVEGTRFRFHDLIRLFARELLEEWEQLDEQQAAKLRTAIYFRDFIREHASDNVALSAERTNLLAAIGWAYKVWLGDPNLRNIGETLIDLVIRVARFLGATASLEARVFWGKRALHVARVLEDQAAIAEACAQTLAWALLQLGRYEEAHAFASEGLRGADGCMDIRAASKLRGDASRVLSGIARDKRDAEDARFWAEQASIYAETSGDEGLARGALLDLGYAALLRRNFLEAEEKFRHLLGLEDRGQDLERTANRSMDVALAILNRALLSEGGAEKISLCYQAHELYDRALLLGRQLDHAVVIGEAELGLGNVARLLGNWDEYERLAASGRQRFEEVGILRPARVEQFLFIDG